MKIVAYCRVSTDKEAQLESLENQKLFFTQFSVKYNHELVKIYADEGISGKQMKNRTEFKRMLSDAKLGMFEMVVVKDISRFARNTVDFLNSVRELKSENIEVQFLATNQTILGNSEFILTIFSALAQEESANLSKRVKFGLTMSAKKGKVPTIIYGYDIVNAQTLKINESEAKVVQDIFDMYVNQGFGTRKIGFVLDNKGITTKKGAKWIPCTIRRMINNTIYAGILINHKYETTDFLTSKKVKRPQEDQIKHERPEYQIVSKEIFDKAQIIMGDRKELYKNESNNTANNLIGHYSNKHLFSTIIKCEHCGYSFCRKYFTTKKSGKTFYWRCSGNNNRTSSFCSNNINILEEDLKIQLKEFLNNLVKNKDEFDKQGDIEYQKRLKINNSKFDIDSAIKQLNKLNSLEDKYKIMFTNDVITINELKSNIKKLNSQKTDLEREIENQKKLTENLKNKNSILQTGFEDIEEFLSFKEEDWTNLKLKKIISSITVNKDDIITYHLKIFDALK